MKDESENGSAGIVALAGRRRACLIGAHEMQGGPLRYRRSRKAEAMAMRFWFEFEKAPDTGGLRLGCGVTARDYDDAVWLLQERIFPEQPLPKFARVVSDVDVQSLDKDHVLPNMGDVTQRGVWFPLGW